MYCSPLSTCWRFPPHITEPHTADSTLQSVFQVIDDSKGHTLVSASSKQPDIRALVTHGGNKTAAALVGRRIAELCLDKQITTVAFDRGGYAYHGRVQGLAEAAREAGLNF